MLAVATLCLTAGMSGANGFEEVEKMVNLSLQIRQRPGTEQLLRDYFEHSGCMNDTVYAVLYGPRNCPRCETFFMKAFYKMMKEHEGNEIALIAAYPSAKAAERYNKKNEFPADVYMYDTTQVYDKIFNFNVGALSVPYVMKIDRKNGRMVVGGNAAFLSDEFIEQLLAYDTPIEMEEFVADVAGGVENSDIVIGEIDVPEFEQTDEYRVETLEGYAVSTVYNLPKFHKQYFVYNDMLEFAVLLFEADEENKLLRQTAIIEADSNERYRFIEIPERKFKQWGDVSYIPLEPDIIDDSTVSVSYSLPNIKYMNGDTTRQGYLNKASVIFRNAATGEPLPMEWDTYDPFTSKYMYAHYTITLYGGYRMEHCYKFTWPMEYARSEYEHITELNPFCDEFYDTPNPILAIFDRKTGLPVKHIGGLEKCQRRSRTGYYYSNPEACVYGDKVAYTNGYTGAVYVCDTADIETPLRRYVAFEIDTDAFPPLDTASFYTYEHARRYDRFFTRCITQMVMTGSTIYCLVKHGVPRIGVTMAGDRYEVMAIDRATGTVERRKFPTLDDGETCLGYGLREKYDGTVAPFIFLRGKAGTPLVREYRTF